MKVGAVIVYTYVYSMLAPPVRPKELEASTSSSDLLQKDETPEGTHEADSENSVSEETAVGIPLLFPEATPAPPQVC